MSALKSEHEAALICFKVLAGRDTYQLLRLIWCVLAGLFQQRLRRETERQPEQRAGGGKADNWRTQLRPSWSSTHTGVATWSSTLAHTQQRPGVAHTGAAH